MKKNCFAAILILFTSGYLCAQGPDLKKADKLYDARCYALAIPYYLKAIENDSVNTSALSNLGNCYRLTNNSQGAVSAYGGLVKSGNANALQKLYYAEALTTEGKFNEAKPYYDQYTVDARGKNKSSTSEKINSYSKNADAYKLTILPFNSTQSDFGAVEHDSSILFLSSRSRSRWINYKQGWTNQSPVRLYSKTSNEPEAKELCSGSSSKINDGSISLGKSDIVYITRNEEASTAKSKNKVIKLKIFKGLFKDGKITGLQPLSFCNTDFNFVHPSISPDGNILYFASDMDGGYGGMDLYKCQRVDNDQWSVPVNLGEKVNTAGNELFPFIAHNNLLYFSSNGHEGLGGLDIYETRIKDGNPGRVYNMGLPVNSKEDDFSLYLQENMKSGYLSSNRKSGGLDDDIYRIEILREVRRGKDLELTIKDVATGKTLPGVKILFGTDSAITNDQGVYTTMIDEDKVLRFTTAYPDYYSNSDSVVASSSNDEKIIKSLSIEKDPKLALVSTVKDLKTSTPLSGVKVNIFELPDRVLLESYTSGETAHRIPLKSKKIGDKISYEFSMEKDGYLPKKSVFIYDIKQPGDINVNETLDLSLGKVEVGMDVGKMIDLKPIYFDLGKSTIRKDAAAELDKIVMIMNEFPNMYIELGSHTDCRSAAGANMKLSAARAKSSAAYIIKKGIDKSRITGKGYGETKLLNGCACEGKTKSSCPEEEHAKNRRTEFIITKLK
jgi:outer membrane protein OmpA-like peptidoglycan-associated protein